MATISQILEEYSEDHEKLFRDAKEQEAINKDTIEMELLSQHDLYLDWAALSAVAESVLEDKKAEFDKVSASCFHAARLSQTTDKKKLTEKAIEEHAKLQSAYQEAQRDYLKAKNLVTSLKKVEQSLVQRSSMLQSVNARQTRELNAAGRQRSYDDSVFDSYKAMKAGQNDE